jgi:hypothetical protein
MGRRIAAPFLLAAFAARPRRRRQTLKKPEPQP